MRAPRETALRETPSRQCCRTGRVRVLACLLSAATLLGGCATYHPKPLDADHRASTFLQSSLDDPALRSFMERALGHSPPAWPLRTWDETNLVLAAFYFSPELKVSRAAHFVAAAGRSTAKERPNPTMGVTPAYNSTTTIPSPWIVTPTLDLPLETGGKRRYRVEEAAHLEEASRWDYASAAWALRARVRKSLLDTQTSGKASGLLKTQLDLQAENLRCSESQHAEGAISAFELSQARNAFNTSRLAFIDAQRQELTTRLALAEAIGVPAEALAGKSFTGPAWSAPQDLPAPPAQAGTRRSALLFRSDLRASLARYAALESALRLELARQYPDVHLNPGYEFDQGDNKWALGLTVTLPVLSRNRGPIAEAEARRSEGEAAFLALQAHVIAEIDMALADYQSTLDAASTVQAAANTLQAEERTAVSMFQAGEISTVDWIALRLQVAANQIALMNTLDRAKQALLALESARQEPDPAWAEVMKMAAHELPTPGSQRIKKAP